MITNPALFNSKFHTNNRLRIRQSNLQTALIVVTANGLLQRGGDSTFGYQQDSNFWYLTGISEPDILLVMDGADDFLIVPSRSGSREAFDGAVDFDNLSRLSGINTVFDSKAGWERLSRAVKKSAAVATLEAAPAYIEQYGMYTNPARARLAEQLKQVVTSAELQDIRKQLTVMRQIKQPEEIIALQQAIDITIDGIAAVTDTKRFAGYNHEYEIEADVTREFRFRGAAGHAFAPIIAAGKQACTLHNVANNAPLAADSLVIMDVGAEVSHYAADLTRTRIYGQPSARQQAVFAAVLDVQNYACSLLKPGTIMKEYEQSVEAYMGETLQSLKLIKRSTRESVRKYYPHSTSHFLGLDVHDVGDYSLPLQPGMVLTCEPGIYIPDENIGVRIEDDILITETGHRELSLRLPKTLM